MATKVQINYDGMESVVSALRDQKFTLQDSYTSTLTAYDELNDRWVSSAATQFFDQFYRVLERFKKLVNKTDTLVTLVDNIVSTMRDLEENANTNFNWLNLLGESIPDALRPRNGYELDHVIHNRIAELQANGFNPDNSTFQIGNLPSDQYGAETVIPVIQNNRDTINRIAAKYNVDPRLLAGVIASEMDFDHAINDRIADALAQNNLIGLPAVTASVFVRAIPGLSIFADPIAQKVDGVFKEGLGVASVHVESLKESIDYMGQHDLPGFLAARDYDFGAYNRASFEGSVEAAAIYTSALTHFKYGSMSPEMSSTDMAVIWGAYRTGVDDFSAKIGDGGYTPEGLRQNEARIDNPNVPERFKVGTNAYMSEPYFDYFINNW